MTVFDIIMTRFVLNMTVFAPKYEHGYVLNITYLVLNITRFVLIRT